MIEAQSSQDISHDFHYSNSIRPYLGSVASLSEEFGCLRDPYE